MGDPLCRGLVCEMESDSPAICPIECYTTHSLRFNSGIELVHSNSSAKSIALWFLHFDIYSLCRASKSGPRS
jgi:hypothetical protein